MKNLTTLRLHHALVDCVGKSFGGGLWVDYGHVRCVAIVEGLKDNPHPGTCVTYREFCAGFGFLGNQLVVPSCPACHRCGLLEHLSGSSYHYLVLHPGKHLTKSLDLYSRDAMSNYSDAPVILYDEGDLFSPLALDELSVC